jgi:hypothetical protein
MIRRFILLIVTCIFLAGCNLPQGTGPQAWIDAPLDGSSLPLAPYTIVFHAFAAGNPQAVELTINSQVVTPDALKLDQPLVTVSYLWSPEKPGRYVIVARTQDQKGTWSEAHTHVVIVGETINTPTLIPSITPTLIPSITPTPTPSITPTQIPSITPTPTPTITATITQPVGPVFSNIRLSANIFYRLDAVPNKVTFTVKVDDPAGIKLVEIYFRLRDPVNSATTNWANEDMKPGGGGMYTYTLSHAHPALTPTSPKTMTLEYQFIVTHPDLSLTRSPVYSDITLQGP